MKRPTLRLVTLGFDNAAALPLRQAVATIEESADLRIRWQPFDASTLRTSARAAPFCTALDDADILLCTSVWDPSDADTLATLLQEYPHVSVVPMTPIDDAILLQARLGDFNAAADVSGCLPAVSAALASSVAPGSAAIPPTSLALLRIGGELGHLFPAEAGDLRTLALVLQAFRNASAPNIEIGLRLISRTLLGPIIPDPGLPEVHPSHGCWHPLTGVTDLPTVAGERPTIGLVCSQRQIMSGNDEPLRALTTALEAEGLDVIGWFGDSDDLQKDLGERIDDVALWLNTTGFTLVGSHGAPAVDTGVELLGQLGTPQISALILSGQTMQEWEASRAGITATSVAMQVSIPELEGGVVPLVIGGRDAATDALVPHTAQIERLARLVHRTIDLRRTPLREQRVALVLISHSPNKGIIGSASSLDVWASLHAVLQSMAAAGYTVSVPESPEALLAAVLTEPEPNGGPPLEARTAARYHAAEYTSEYSQIDRVVAGWGPAPGEFDTDGIFIDIHGLHLGNVLICIQPSKGYGADPAGLLFNPNASPTHSFAAFYTWLATQFQPHALLHFGTHGALEFMPGKQVGLDSTDFSDQLIGDVPHAYFYVASNPAEAAIAKRRSYATIVNHLSPPLDKAETAGALAALREDVTACSASNDPARRQVALDAVVAAAEEEGLHHDADPVLATTDPPAYLQRLAEVIDEVSETLISVGLHIAGRGIPPERARTIMRAACDHDREEQGLPSLIDAGPTVDQLVDAVIAGTAADQVILPISDAVRAGWYRFLTDLMHGLASNDEIGALLSGLAGQYVPPGPGGDPIREPGILPTGRNTYSINPFTIPTPRAVRRGREMVTGLLERALEDGSLPESVALVVWGIDTIKTRGEAVAQAFALIGVEPQTDANGRVSRFRVLDLKELGRPRIDVVITPSGVFRDLFGNVMELLDSAIRAVAVLDEPTEQNFVRKHALDQARAFGMEVADAATRIFSNEPGNYGSGVNHLVEASAWESSNDLGEVFVRRQAHAYGRHLSGENQEALFRSALRTVEVTFQNIDSSEISIADTDHYFEYLGGVSAAVTANGGGTPRVLVADGYSPRPKIRDIDDAIRLESRTRMLNPKWYEGMLAHGFQGVSEVGKRLENTFGWSATIDAVDDWIFSAAAATFLFDDTLRNRMAALNPAAVKAMADRLIEADRRNLWDATDDERSQLEAVAGSLDDAMEGIHS